MISSRSPEASMAVHHSLHAVRCAAIALWIGSIAFPATKDDGIAVAVATEATLTRAFISNLLLLDTGEGCADASATLRGPTWMQQGGVAVDACTDSARVPQLCDRAFMLTSFELNHLSAALNSRRR